MKTSVLLSWEVPDSYKSAVPFRVGGAGWAQHTQSPPARLRSQSSVPQAWEGAPHPNTPPAPPPRFASRADPVQRAERGGGRALHAEADRRPAA